jgi:DGQHR domain-containing protein
MEKKSDGQYKFNVIRGIVLGVKVYRGFTELGLLSDISKADIYDQNNNPSGTQRDLNVNHARDAYRYIKDKEFGFWPEVFLCARDNQILSFELLSSESDELGVLTITLPKNLEKKILISRVDGNHRLHFGDGKQKGYSRIATSVSFCLAYDLSRDEEIQLFKDINKNQRPMNTSHLDNIEVRLTKEEELKKLHPDLFIAQKLNTDPKSPLKDKIYEGGVRDAALCIPLRSLRTGIQYMFSRSTQLPRLSDATAQYNVIRNYFIAAKRWMPQAWDEPKKYIMLRGVGLWALCFLGSEVIDRALMQDKYKEGDFLQLLESGKNWDWSTQGDFKGMSGRGGALEISNRIARFIQDDNHLSTNQLFIKILSDG